MSDIKLKVVNTLEAVKSDTALADGHRDALTDMLVASEIAVNGTADKIGAMADAIGAMAVYLARREKYERAYIDARVKGHTDACPFRGPVSGKLAVLYPYRNQIVVLACVGAMYPNVLPAIKLIIGVLT